MAGFNIDSFRANGLVDGGARPSLFEVRMTGIPGAVGTIQNSISFMCSAASIPSSEMDIIEVPYFGRKIKLAGERIFRAWNITIMNDENFGLRDMFESWSNKMNAMVSNRQNSAQGNLLDYKVDSVEVLQYGKAGPGDDSGVIRGYNFFGMFPQSVSPIALDWSRGNQLETFDVTLEYDYWTPSDVGSSNLTYDGFLNPV